jgi:Uma2 family endonuclease
LIALFEVNRKQWSIRPVPEQRVQVRSNRYRIPDIALQRRSDPKDLILTVPPLLCIEILSSADTLRDIQLRVNDYAEMGVPNIWVIDPWKRLGYYATVAGFTQPKEGILRIEDTPISVTLAEAFADLDEDYPANEAAIFAA